MKPRHQKNIELYILCLCFRNILNHFFSKEIIIMKSIYFGKKQIFIKYYKNMNDKITDMANVYLHYLA
jgi:hypothetical protein